MLSKAEQEKFMSEPTFTLQEKEYYFKIPKLLLEDLSSSKNRILMTLIWGYYRATNKFYFDFSQQSNIEFVANLYDCKIKQIDSSSTTLYRYKMLIKEYLNINDYTKERKLVLQKEANSLSNNFIHRKKIFYILVNLAKKLYIILSLYHFYQQLYQYPILLFSLEVLHNHQY